MKKFRAVILQNIMAPTKTLLFNALELVLKQGFKVLYIAKTSDNREWRTIERELKFSFDIMFKDNIDNINPIRMAVQSWRKLNFYDPDVVIIGGYIYLACWATLIWAKKNKRKAIVIIESHYLDRPRFRIKESIKKLFVSYCDAALVDGIRHRDYTVSLGMKPENIFIKKGAGPIDVSLYQEEGLWLKSNKRKLCDKFGFPHKNFLYVGRFAHEKNIMFLLRTYNRFKDEGMEEWGLILVGNGPQRREIENFISNIGIKDVLLPGFKQKEEILMFYIVSDVFILPSISEPWGLVVGEAMASGLPVLVSNRCGCYPDIVQDGVNGFAFDPFNEHELLGFMKDIAKGKYDLEAMGGISLEIIKDYTPEKAAMMYLNAINFVLNKSKRRNFFA